MIGSDKKLKESAQEVAREMSRNWPRREINQQTFLVDVKSKDIRSEVNEINWLNWMDVKDESFVNSKELV